ncbi:MAG: twin-arginine translocase subunit TatC [Bdellovibrionales bacterium]|nr:twin-arginine translocase subunit TatC [Bdellovibrionales bacterium]
MTSANEDANQTLIEHLTELRVRIMWSLLWIFCGFVLCWGFSDVLFDIIRRPIAPYLKDTTGGLVFTAPTDKFIAHIKVSGLFGVILSCPFWIYNLWKFIVPALYEKEKKFAVSFVGFGSCLFLLGVNFVYFIVLPMAFKFLMTFGGTTDSPMITIGEYLSFFIMTTLVFGAAFEMPLVLALLGVLGVITSDFLRNYRRYAYVLLALASALFTPPDALSMVMMLVPMMLLYESSVLLVKMMEKMARDKEKSLTTPKL